MDTPTVSDLNTHEDSEEGAEVRELRQKLTMATEELETVRAELTMQLHQTRQVAEATKEESEGKENWVLPNLTKEKVQKHLASLKKLSCGDHSETVQQHRARGRAVKGSKVNNSC